MSLTKATEYDRAGDFVAAAAEYEDVLAKGNRSITVLLNLGLLYWQANSTERSPPPPPHARPSMQRPELAITSP